VQEAIEEAIDCLGSTVSIRMSMKEDIPEPSRSKRGQRLIPVPSWIAGKLGLYLAMRERGLSNSEFARRLGVRETVVPACSIRNTLPNPRNSRRRWRCWASTWQ